MIAGPAVLSRRGAPGVLIGLAVAVKFFVWPVWLAATRRFREAVLAAAVAAASLLLVLPFMSLQEYAHALTRLSSVFDQDSYNVYACSCRRGQATPWAVVRRWWSESSSSPRSGATRASRWRSARRS